MPKPAAATARGTASTAVLANGSRSRVVASALVAGVVAAVLQLGLPQGTPSAVPTSGGSSPTLPAGVQPSTRDAEPPAAATAVPTKVHRPGAGVGSALMLAALAAAAAAGAAVLPGVYVPPSQLRGHVQRLLAQVRHLCTQAYSRALPPLPPPPPPPPGLSPGHPSQPRNALARQGGAATVRKAGGSLGARFEGLTLAAVLPNGPAAHLLPFVGCRVVAVNGAAVHTFPELAARIDGVGEVELVFSPPPPSAAAHASATTPSAAGTSRPPLGAKFAGMTLSGVGPGSVAEAMGLSQYVGWTATHVNGEEVSCFDDIAQVVGRSGAVSFRFEPPPLPPATSSPRRQLRQQQLPQPGALTPVAASPRSLAGHSEASDWHAAPRAGRTVAATGTGAAEWPSMRTPERPHEALPPALAPRSTALERIPEPAAVRTAYSQSVGSSRVVGWEGGKPVWG
eukprot:TRINITY_DN2759_c6_g1_i1.p1 TRINITY_DN2759_c6_g1~~TRINITY_DN2759_c6_g1_i1.p1  ORF type:complete len:469 (+),score=105.14 TRINITY_DN2759_c6_g1_i1:49-1407(+)